MDVVLIAVQIDINLMNCEFKQKHTYVDTLCIYCGHSYIPKDNYNGFDGWFPYAAKHSDLIFWSNYRCNGLRRWADTFKEYEEIWRHFRDLPPTYPKHVYYAIDNLMEIPYPLTNVEVYKFGRCKECQPCIMYAGRVVIAKLMDKANKFGVKAVYMWTFGTNLPDLPRHRVTLRLAWQKTCTYLANWYKRPKNQGGFSYSPIFKVIETGKKSKLLHIHAIFISPIEFFLVRKTWARYAKIVNPNVNYTTRESTDPLRAFSYVAKYAAKSVGNSRNWSFMGKFYGNKKS